MRKFILGILFWVVYTISALAQSNTEIYAVQQSEDGTTRLTDFSLQVQNGVQTYQYKVIPGTEAARALEEKLYKKYISEEQRYNLQETLKGYYIMAGYTNNGGLTGNPQDNDYWIIKLFPYIKKEGESNALLFPNPCIQSTTLFITKDFLEGFSIFIYDLLGNKLKYIPIKTQGTKISVKDLAPGVYMYSVKSSKKQGPTGKIVIQ